jgi:hypothetical protein
MAHYTEGGNATAQTLVEQPSTADPQSGLSFLKKRDVHQPQFASAGSGVLYVVWRETGKGGSNLFIARRDVSDIFSPPVRINDAIDSVESGDRDEMRVGVGVAGDFVGAAWSTEDSEIRAAISRDGGRHFEKSVNLNSDAGAGVYRGFVGTDVDSRGVLHAAWIDARDAPPGREEPAELMYARVADGIAFEQNLTADQPDSICGCCHVDLDVQGESVVIAFRNAEGGYRDIFRVVGDLGGDFAAPARLGPPMWKLHGCPTFGPANVGDTTIWGEGSTGKRRLLAATNTGGDFKLLLEDNDDWWIARPARAVVNSVKPMILVPGEPTGKLLVDEGESWRVVADDLPNWAMSAVLEGSEVTLMGAIMGEIRVQIRSVEF